MNKQDALDKRLGNHFSAGSQTSHPQNSGTTQQIPAPLVNYKPALKTRTEAEAAANANRQTAPQPFQSATPPVFHASKGYIENCCNATTQFLNDLAEAPFLWDKINCINQQRHQLKPLFKQSSLLPPNQKNTLRQWQQQVRENIQKLLNQFCEAQTISLYDLIKVGNGLKGCLECNAFQPDTPILVHAYGCFIDRWRNAASWPINDIGMGNLSNVLKTAIEQRVLDTQGMLISKNPSFQEVTTRLLIKIGQSQLQGWHPQPLANPCNLIKTLIEQGVTNTQNQLYRDGPHLHAFIENLFTHVETTGFTIWNPQGQANLSNLIKTLIEKNVANSQDQLYRDDPRLHAVVEKLFIHVETSGFKTREGQPWEGQSCTNLSNLIKTLIEENVTNPQGQLYRDDPRLHAVVKKLFAHVETTGFKTWEAQSCANLSNLIKTLVEENVADSQDRLYRDNPRLHAVVDKLFAHVDTTGFKTWYPQEQSNLSNLIKTLIEKNVTNAQNHPYQNNPRLHAVAEKLFAHVEKTGFKTWEAQHCANLSNLIKTLFEENITNSQGQLYRDDPRLHAVAEKLFAHVETTGFKTWETQHCANLSNLIKTLIEENITNAQGQPYRNNSRLHAVVEKLFIHVETSGFKTREGQPWGGQSCTNLSNLIKTLIEENVSNAQNQLYRDDPRLHAIAEKLFAHVEKTGFKTWEAQHCANFSNLIKTLIEENVANNQNQPYRNNSRLHAIAEKLFAHVETTGFKTWETQHCSNLSNLIKTLIEKDVANTQNQPYRNNSRLHGVAEKLFAHVETTGFNTWKAQHCANLSNLIKTLIEKDVTSTQNQPYRNNARLHAIAEKLFAHVEKTGFNTWEVQHCTNFSNLIKTLIEQNVTNAQHQPYRDDPRLHAVAEKLFAHVETTGFNTWKAQHCANLSNLIKTLIEKNVANAQHQPYRTHPLLLTITAQLLHHVIATALTGWNRLELASTLLLLRDLIKYDMLATTSAPNLLPLLHPACSALLARLAQPFAQPLTGQDFPYVVNALGSLARHLQHQNIDPTLTTQVRQALTQMVHTPIDWNILNANDIATVLQALHHAEALDTLTTLAPACLARLHTLAASQTLSTETLSVLGNLCWALRPFLQTATLRRFRSQVVPFLAHTLLPLAWQAMERHAAASSAALPFYQILKSGHLTVSHYSRRNVPRNPQDPQTSQTGSLSQRRKTLTTKNQRAYALLQQCDSYDLSQASWNLIAALEADDATTILDTFVRNHHAEILRERAPAQFDASAVFAKLAGKKLHLPPSTAPSMRIAKCRFNGHPTREPEQRHTLLSLMTGSAMQLIDVELPGHLSAYMLGRTVTFEGQRYRVDATGGSKMKDERETLGDIFASAEAALQEQATTHEDAPSYGSLYAIPLADTVAGTPFARLMAQLFPYREAYFYFQRALMAQAADLCKRYGGTSHLLQGEFKVSFVPDNAPAGQQFQLRTWKIRPFDGCGFMRQSVAEQFPWYAELVSGKVRPYGGQQEGANLPSDALQHLPANEAVARELVGTVSGLSGQSAKKGEALYRAIAQGDHGKGHIAVAIPSSNGRVYVPLQKSLKDDRLVLSHAPYEDLARIYPVMPEDLVTSQDDPTVQAVSSIAGVQYSFVMCDEGVYSFCKGILLIVPDDQWPQSGPYARQDMVLSAEDEKMRSGWDGKKARYAQAAHVRCPGMFATTEVYAPGSFVAMPTNVAKEEMNTDCDGDAMLMMSGLPHYHAHVLHAKAAVAEQPQIDLKPAKSHHGALDAQGEYQFSRASQIIAAKLPILGRYTVMQRMLWALPDARQDEVGQALLAEVCDGASQEAMSLLREALDEDALSADKLLQAQAVLRQDAQAVRDPGMQRLYRELLDDCEEARSELQGKTRSKHPAERPGLMALAQAHGCGQEPLGNALDRLALWLDVMPWRALGVPESVLRLYRDGLPGLAARHLITHGIEAGENAPKSDNQARLYASMQSKLERVLRAQAVAVPPYRKATARLLAKGELYKETAQQLVGELQDNPTLAGQVMRLALLQLQGGGQFPAAPMTVQKPVQKTVPTTAPAAASLPKTRKVANADECFKIGPLYYPYKNATINEQRSLMAEDGLQVQKPSSTANRFVNVAHDTAYLWVVDYTGVRISLETPAKPLAGFPATLKHTNLSFAAAVGGMVWFNTDGSIRLNANSGRFGKENAHSGFLTKSQWEASKHVWRSLGYAHILDKQRFFDD